MKLLNEYAKLGGAGFYEDTPKAVWAALACSFANRCGDGDLDDLDAIPATLLNEWRALHANGIVPQAPPLSRKESRNA